MVKLVSKLAKRMACPFVSSTPRQSKLAAAGSMNAGQLLIAAVRGNQLAAIQMSFT
jgi:hypothetical protein